jgi:hypothetical protein
MGLGVTGCASDSQIMDSEQEMAIQTALQRAQFEMSCPEATGIVLSRESMEPAMQGAYVVGVARAEYTVGVTGCGKKDTYVVVCPLGGDGCFAADSRNR